jgi:3-hydroxybutyryl-CoA dehydratase
MLGLTASHFSTGCAMLGMEFSVKLLRPIFADETIRLEWLVRRVTYKEKLRGDIVQLVGRIQNQQRLTALRARGTVLVTQQL